jgi:hypothetical protein
MSEFRQLEIGMSMSLNFPAMGTAGFALVLVSGYNREPAPPAMMMATVLCIIICLLVSLVKNIYMNNPGQDFDIYPIKIDILKILSRFVCKKMPLITGKIEGHASKSCHSADPVHFSALSFSSRSAV